MTTRQNKSWPRILRITLANLLFLPATVAYSVETLTVEELGRQRFVESCAACHGENAKGGGVVANLLTAKPADLTQLSKRNGGTFPFGKIYDAIDGRQKHAAHISHEMPVWGRLWQEGGPYERSETFVRGRILEMVIYLRSIQQ